MVGSTMVRLPRRGMLRLNSAAIRILNRGVSGKAATHTHAGKKTSRPTNKSQPIVLRDEMGARSMGKSLA